MNQSLVQKNHSIDKDEWDTDGFEIPSLGIEDCEQSKADIPGVDDSKSASSKDGKEEKIYLGPHAAHPQQAKQQELNHPGRKQKFKQKLKEANRRNDGSGRENKIENLRDLVGAEKTVINMANNSPREWLDPHCHESEFEKHHTDGFEIPSLGIEDCEQSKADVPVVDDSKSASYKDDKEGKIYLGPHGAPPQQAKQQELNPSGRKQKFKQKLKEADQRNDGSGRENKIDNLRDLVGAEKIVINMANNSPREWLDPHCHESEFEKHRA